MINIQNNSRDVKPGDTFVAIVGHITDGHKYIEDAIKRGATKVIVSDGKTYPVETINVDNTEEYLNKYMVDNYSKDFEDMKIIGITGTNGKTTTAFMTYEALRKLNINVAYLGTIGFFYNDNFEKTLNTTPDILNLYKYLEKAKENNCNIVILEASSVALQVGRLNGIKFDVTIFTNLTHEHMEDHHTMKNYLHAKLLINDKLKENGISIVNTDDKYGEYFKTKNTITYGYNNTDMLCIKNNDTYNEFTCTYKGNTYSISSSLYGKYNIYNIMASLVTLDYLGINLNDVTKIYNKLTPPKGRMNVTLYGTNKIIIDYAHTPDGVEKVLTAAKNMTNGHIYTVFGCTGDREKEKRPMMGKTVEKYSDYFIITDDDPHYEDEMAIAKDVASKLTTDKYEIIVDRKKAIERGIELLNENDILLILGKGHEESIRIKDQNVPHNDEEHVLQILKKNGYNI